MNANKNNSCGWNGFSAEFLSGTDITLCPKDWEYTISILPELKDETWEYGKWEFVPSSFKPCIKNTVTGEIYEYK